MRLWLCGASSTDCEPSGLVVAETEKEAIEKFEKELDDSGLWFSSVYADKITEVDGYGIALIKNVGKLNRKPRIQEEDNNG